MASEEARFVPLKVFDSLFENNPNHVPLKRTVQPAQEMQLKIHFFKLGFEIVTFSTTSRL
jgi:hypothetical protein